MDFQSRVANWLYSFTNDIETEEQEKDSFEQLSMFIEYYHEMEGHKTREILQIRHPTDSPYSVVVVDDFYAIGRNKRVRLVERSLPDGSTEKVYGIFRDVKKFILKVGGRQDGLSGVVTDRANEVNKTRDKVRRKAMEEMKKDGTEVYSDLLD